MGFNDIDIKVSGGSDIISTLKTYTTRILKPNIVDGKNVLTQEMLSSKNTKYVIKYDFTLAEDVTIPANCVLQFDGGSIDGEYTLTGNNTTIQAGLVKIFVNVLLRGNFRSVPYWYVEWFGASSTLTDNSAIINSAIDRLEQLDAPSILKLESSYIIKDTIYLYKNVSIEGSYITSRPINSGSFKGTILTNFSSEKWAIDTKNYSNNTIPPYNKLNLTDAEYPGNQTNHNISKLHFQTINGTTAYGAIRTHGMYGGCIKDVTISDNYGIGIAITHFSWGVDVSNITNRANTLGFYFGKSVTSLNVANVAVVNYRSMEPLTVFPLISEYSSPSYASYKTVGVVFESCGVVMSGCDIQGFDFGIIGYYYTCSLLSPYFEHIAVGIAYLGRDTNNVAYRDYNTKLYLDFPRFQNVADQSSYQFGVASGSRGVIEAYGYNYSRCWDNGNDCVNYIIKVNPNIYALNIFDDIANNTKCKQKVFNWETDERGRVLIYLKTCGIVSNAREDIYKISNKLNWVAHPDTTNYNFGSNGYIIDGGDLKLTSNINLRCDTPISIANTRLELDTKADNFGWHTYDSVHIYNGNSCIVIDKPIIVSDLTGRRFSLKGEGVINLQIEIPNDDLTLAKATLLTDVNDFVGIYTITVKYNSGVYIIQGDTRNAQNTN